MHGMVNSFLKKYFFFTKCLNKNFLIEFASINEIMENLEKNTAYWREMCESQKQEPNVHTTSTNRHSLQQQQDDIRSRNESIVESMDENS